MIDVDARLRWAIEEVVRLQEEARFGVAAREGGEVEFPPEDPRPMLAAVAREVPAEVAAGRPPGRASQLTPKEIQSHLRAGLSLQEVARLAGTEIAWIERFIGPILAEREGIVEAVKASVISRPRLGRSGVAVGDAIVANLRERKLNVSPEVLNDGWRAVRRAGAWEVTFRYTVRGQIRDAHFGFDVDTRAVKALNQVASQIGWRPGIEAGTPADQQDSEELEESQESQETPEPEAPTRPPTVPTGRATPPAKGQPARGQAARVGTGAGSPVTPASARGGQRAPRPGPPGEESPRRQGPVRNPGAARNPGTGPRGSSFSPESAERGPEQARRADPAARRGPSPRGAGPSDERRSFARSSSSPRPRRLLTDADGPEWNEAVARKRASRTGAAGSRSGRGSEAPNQSQRPRPQKKRLPDDWLLDD